MQHNQDLHCLKITEDYHCLANHSLEVDTIEMVIQIPHEKPIRLKSLLVPLLWNRRIKLKEFESIVGLMAFCSKALTSSEIFYLYVYYQPIE
jgi:hypothetical protein